MTDSEMVEGVPTKIVMVGTSSMSLHQRFSRMPKPKLVTNKLAVDRGTVSVRGRARGASFASRRSAVMRSQQVYEILEPMATDFVEEFVPVSPPLRRVRTPLLYRRPIEERVTLPPTPQVVYVPVPVSRNQRRTIGAKGHRGRNVSRNHGLKNGSTRGVINNSNFKNHPSATRGARGGAARRRGHYAPLPKKSVSQLDRELEDYMRKSKHPKIVI